MSGKRELLPVEDVDLSGVEYEPQVIDAPHLTGFVFKMFVKIIEAPLIGSLIISYLRGQNRMNKLLLNTVVPETPMFKPEYPPQEREELVVEVKEDDPPEERVETSLKCLPQYDPNVTETFRYWKIRDYAHAYRSHSVTPSIVAENVISILDEFHKNNHLSPMLIAYDFEDLRKQAAASTKRFEEGTPKSVLDGIFVAIKDDITCFPYISKGATTWLSSAKKDAVCVSKLRKCGVIFVGKANMHELGMGTTGNNPNYGTTRNPHDVKRYTGGSSSGPAAIVASGICSAALGTDGGGSVRIPSSLCGIVGLKTTYGRTDLGGLVLGSGTVEIVGPLTSSVEDSILIYAAILGSSPEDRISLKPGGPCIPNLQLRENLNVLGNLRLGKYSAWFNDVLSTQVSNKCSEMLDLLTRTHGCQVAEVVIPELEEMGHAHVVSIGSEMLSSLTPHFVDGISAKLNYDTRTNNALFRSFTASDYIVAQKMRRRLMHHHMEIFKKVDVIVTPTTGMTAPEIPPSALKYGETHMRVTGYLMRFVAAANLLGFPAISVPVGYDKNGLPIGLQFIGRPWGEATIIRLASAVEELGPPKRKPSVFYDVLKTR